MISAALRAMAASEAASLEADDGNDGANDTAAAAAAEEEEDDDDDEGVSAMAATTADCGTGSAGRPAAWPRRIESTGSSFNFRKHMNIKI